MKKSKLLIFIVAYNHEKTIESVIKRIPKKLTNLYKILFLCFLKTQKGHFISSVHLMST